MERDRMGRRRRPEQERGLRPLHPLLPEQWTSQGSARDDVRGRLDPVRGAGALAGPRRPTQARAYGLALATLMHSANLPKPEPGPLDWMDWERRKTLRLLLSS